MQDVTFELGLEGCVGVSQADEVEFGWGSGRHVDTEHCPCPWEVVSMGPEHRDPELSPGLPLIWLRDLGLGTDLL